MENFALPIGNTNIGVYLFGLASLTGVAYAARTRGAWVRLGLAALAAVFGMGSLVSGIIVWPLAWLTLLIAGASWRLLVGWAVVSGLAIALYFHGYVSPGYLGDPLVNMRKTGPLTDFLLLYFGGPIAGFGPLRSAAAGIVAIIVFTGATYGARVSGIGRHRAVLALAAIGIFIVCTGLMTSAGRIALGNAAAQVSRYATPVLIFWSVSLLLLISVPVARSVRMLPLRALQIVLPAFALFCLMRVEPLGDWIVQTAFKIRQTGVAVALGITDPPHEELGGVPHDRVWTYRPLLAEHHSSMFHDAERLGIGAKLADRFATAPSRECLGYIDSVTPVQAPSDGVRLDGWAWDVVRNQAPRYVLFSDDGGTIVGWAETGGPRSDVAASFPQTRRGSPGFGGYALLPRGGRPLAFVLNEAEGTVCPF